MDNTVLRKKTIDAFIKFKASNLTAEEMTELERLLHRYYIDYFTLCCWARRAQWNMQVILAYLRSKADPWLARKRLIETSGAEDVAEKLAALELEKPPRTYEEDLGRILSLLPEHRRQRFEALATEYFTHDHFNHMLKNKTIDAVYMELNEEHRFNSEAIAQVGTDDKIAETVDKLHDALMKERKLQSNIHPLGMTEEQYTELLQPAADVFYDTTRDYNEARDATIERIMMIIKSIFLFRHEEYLFISQSLEMVNNMWIQARPEQDLDILDQNCRCRYWLGYRMIAEARAKRANIMRGLAKEFVPDITEDELQMLTGQWTSQQCARYEFHPPDKMLDEDRDFMIQDKPLPFLVHLGDVVPKNRITFGRCKTVEVAEKFSRESLANVSYLRFFLAWFALMTNPVHNMNVVRLKENISRFVDAPKIDPTANMNRDIYEHGKRVYPLLIKQEQKIKTLAEEIVEKAISASRTQTPAQSTA